MTIFRLDSPIRFSMVQVMPSIGDKASETALQLSHVRHLARSGEARRLRLRGDLTQADIARSLGVSGATVSCWESGKYRPTGAAALHYGRLLNALGALHRDDDDHTD
jgi:DNA-binding transcriptional regulator YiaG